LTHKGNFSIVHLIKSNVLSKNEQQNLSAEKIPDLIKEVRQHIPPFLETNLRKVTDEDVARICEASLKGWE
jgi:hypothetical protein